MARKSADADTRIAILLAARAQAVPDDVVNAEDMARIAGMTWRNLKVRIDQDPGFPVQRRGAEGIAWEFRVIDVLDHMVESYRAVITANNEKAAKVARMAGIEIPKVRGGGSISLSDFQMINRLQMDAQRRKIEQREYVPRAEVWALMTDFFTMVQSEVLATASQLDPAGQWPADTRADVADHMRGVLVRVHDRFGAWISDDARSGARSRTRVRGSGAGRTLRQRA